ncbi:MAG TPA: hypothetical protein VF044_05630 [Actinomycetota bacterium]
MPEGGRRFDPASDGYVPAVRTVVTLERNDDMTLPSVATTLRSVPGVRAVDVDEASSSVSIDADPDTVTEDELLTVIGMEGVRVLDARSSDER